MFVDFITYEPKKKVLLKMQTLDAAKFKLNCSAEARDVGVRR